MAINDTVKNVRKDFVEQMPGFRRLVPVFFYSTKTGKDYTGVLLPYRYKGSKSVNFIWGAQEYYWEMYTWGGNSEPTMTRINYSSRLYDLVSKVIKMYKKEGFEF